MKKTPNTTKVLSALQALDAPLCADVARHARISDATVYRILRRMLAESWVAGRADGKRTRYYLTPLGETWAEAWAQPIGDDVIRVRRRADYVRVIPWTGTNLAKVMAFVGANAVYEGGVLTIVTPDTRERCAVGDWIIEGVNNFWRVTPHEFHAMFEVP